MTLDELKAIIRTVPDFPKPGIQFRDITTLIAHGRGFSADLASSTPAQRRGSGRNE